MKRKHLIVIAVAVSLAGAVVVGSRSEQAEAAVCTNPGYASDVPTNIFPRGLTGMRENAGCGNADSFIWMSEYWTGSTVNVPTSNLRIFYNINQVNPQPWTFDTITFQTLSTGNHRCGSRVQVQLVQSGQTQEMYRNPSASCAIQMPAGLSINKGMLQSNPSIYGNDIRYVDLVMSQLTLDSNAPIRVVSSFWGAKITFRESAVSALWSYADGASTTDPITYVLNFSPDCRYANGNIIPITLSWFDADQGAPPQGSIEFRMFLVDDTTGLHVTPPGGLSSSFYFFGGDDQDGSWSTNIVGGHKYRWIWSGIVRSNGIQVRMPFSEINADPAANCIPPNQLPSGSLSASCNSYGTVTVGVSASDPDGGVPPVSVTVGGATGGTITSTGTHYRTGTQNGVTYTVSGNMRDAQTGQVVNFTSVTYSCRAPITVQGRVMNAYNMAIGYGGIEIETCIPNGVGGTIKAYTNASGNFTFSSPYQTGYCVRVNNVGIPAGALYAERRVRPWSEGYDVCGGYNGGYFAPNYCASRATYEYQQSAIDAAGIDRASDTGFDFVMRFRPTISCTLTAPGIIQTGASYTPQVQVTHTGSSNRPPAAGTVTVNVNGTPRYANYSLTYGNSTTLSFAPVVIGAPGNFTVTASATGSGDSIDISPNPAVCPSQNLVVGNYSYLKSFGGNVAAGGAFLPGSCAAQPGRGGIYAFAEPSGGAYRGASAQFTVTALLSINSLYSVSNRTPGVGNTFPPKGLTISNEGGSTYGGNNGSGGRCITDYFASTRDSQIAVAGSFPPPSTPSVPVYGLNIAPLASSVTATSEYPPGAQTFFASHVVDGITGMWGTGEWASNGNAPAPNSVLLQWGSPQNIGRVVLYDRPNSFDNILSGTLMFSDGSQVPFGTLPSNGLTPATITFPARNVTSVRVRIDAFAGPNIGLSEVQVYPVTGTIPGSNGFIPGRAQYEMPAGTTLGGITIPNGSQVAVYVDGDVFINNNIVYDPAARGSTEAIPYFALIVNGDIRIAPNVTRLDGLYVAQPDNGAAGNGVIRTCAPSLAGNYTAANVYINCQNQLSVNGSFIAREIKFLRLRGTLAQATFQEVPTFGDGVGTNAAEVFNYTAEMWLAPSPLKRPSDVPGSDDAANTPLKYDAVRSLPPIY